MSLFFSSKYVCAVVNQSGRFFFLNYYYYYYYFISPLRITCFAGSQLQIGGTSVIVLGLEKKAF